MEFSETLDYSYIYGDINCLFSEFNMIKLCRKIKFYVLDGFKIFDSSFQVLAFNKRKSKWTNSVTLKIAERGTKGTITVLLNPDPDNQKFIEYNGKTDLLIVEVERSDCRVRFNNFPNSDFSAYEIAAEPFDLNNYNLSLAIFQCA